MDNLWLLNFTRWTYLLRLCTILLTRPLQSRSLEVLQCSNKAMRCYTSLSHFLLQRDRSYSLVLNMGRDDGKVFVSVLRYSDRQFCVSDAISMQRTYSSLRQIKVFFFLIVYKIKWLVILLGLLYNVPQRMWMYVRNYLKLTRPLCSVWLRW